MRSRSVLCIKNDQIVGDSLCLDSNNVDSTAKPITLEKCEITDVSYCKPKWHYSEWSEVKFEFLQLFSIYFQDFIGFTHLYKLISSAHAAVDQAHNGEL